MLRISLKKVPKDNAGYQGPDQGPFECEHCIYFSEPSSCKIVEGDISPHGCCNNFKKDPNRRPDSEDKS